VSKKEEKRKLQSYMPLCLSDIFDGVIVRNLDIPEVRVDDE
jgi:hypothetical protein